MAQFPKTFTTRDRRELKIELAKKEHFPEVCEFLNHHFFVMSPSCYLFNGNPINDPGMLEFISVCLRDPVSMIVRDSTDCLVAVRLNLLEEPNNRHKSLTLSNNELIVSLVSSLEKGIDVFTIYKTNKTLILQMLGVHQQYCGLGLGSTLVKLSLELAEKHGAGAVAVVALNEAAAKLAANNGLESLRTIDYATFEVNGVKPLANEAKLLAEHRVAKLMARSIP